MFYNQYVNGHHPTEDGFLGHFDFLLWKDLQKDLSACERLQRKPFYKIALVSGNAVYQSKAIQIPISGCNIIFSDPFSRFSFTTSDEKFEGQYCVFSDTFLRGTSKFSLATLPIFQSNDIYVKPLSKLRYDDLMILFEQIQNEHGSAYPYKEQLIRNRILDVIHYVQKLDENFYNFGPTGEERLNERFLKTLENAFYDINLDNILESKSPSYYAELLNTTVDNLNKVLKASMGRTTQAIIQDRIIEEANVLLRHTSLSVKEIGWCMRFLETSHFQNFYKRLTGYTPVQYRTR
ncbi:helix-turn-helix transcriptional regulator [Pedobacter sp. 22163]|uniref:helix-turn-helix transcriptional regulator n=1 Tax=Pedobacter sp. 22163 TaxID=3453883 RepID=UPI003F87E2CE